MRKAAEAGNDLHMPLGISEISGRRRILRSQLAMKTNRFALVVEIFAMLEGQVKENALD